jgi:periplasmic protein TonB
VTDPAIIPARRLDAREAARWIVCFVLIVAAHCALALAVLAQWDHAAPGAPPAVIIELAALPVAPSPAVNEAPPGPEATASEAQSEPEPNKSESEIPTETKEEVKEEVEPEPVIEEVEEKQPQQQEAKLDLPPPPVPESITIPELIPAPKPEVALPAPAPARPKPEPKPKQEVKRKPPPEKKQVSRAAPATTAPQAAPRVAQRQASLASVGSNASMPDWRARIVAHLQRNKRFPAGVQSAGTASVRFTIDRNGRVLSSGLAGSSGVTALDAEAVAMIGRSNPFPPAPADVTGGPFSFSVPVRFTQR